jgi:uncharacterized repeat protein (TIGR01451 family)
MPSFRQRRGRTRLRSVLAALTVTGLAVAGLTATATVIPTSAARAADGPAWTCTSSGYLFQSPNLLNPPHTISQVNLATGTTTQIGSTADLVNAVGYNTTDNYMYGIDFSTQRPVQIASDGTLTQLPLPTGMVAGNYNTGTFDGQGHYWIAQSAGIEDGSRWYEIDYNVGSTTYGTVLASGEFANNIIGSDWAFSGQDLYSVQDGSNHLISFNTTTHALTDLGALSGVPASYYGAVYSDAAGYVYASNNQTGEIYRITPSTRTALDLTAGPPSNGNDGAFCSAAQIPTVTVTKTVASRAASADQFTVGLRNGSGTVLTSATTTGTATTASTTNFPVTNGQTYTITDAMAAGSTNNLGVYAASLVCTDTTTGQRIPTGGSKGAWTLRVTTTDAYTCAVTNGAPAPTYTVKKIASTATVTPGGRVTYSVQVTNTGQTDYTAANPATFTDDLSKVLDDARYNGDATDGATVNGTTLSWSGALAAGQTRTITYSVTVNDPDTGDKVLTNAVTPTTTGGSCVTAADCTTTTPVQSLQITKTANRTDVVPGQRIDYTITVKNTGKVAYTTGGNAASFTDDLSKVLDDANWNDDPDASAGTVSYDQPTLSWSGPITVGATVTITYSVTVKDPDTGDSQIDNAVVSNSPGSNCAANSTDPSCQVSIPSGSYTVTKAASTSVANPGDTITYTVTVANTGRIAYMADAPASFRDDLSQVTDDATYVAGSATNGAVVDGNTVTWSGPLPVGGTQTITYQVKVNNPDTGNKTVTNTVAPTGPGGQCDTAADCSTTTLVRSYTVTKTASEQTAAPGQKVTYTVTVTNTGTADYTTATPAAFTDDLSKVLDDATYNNDATQGATVTGNTLSWSGALAAGKTVTVTYSVTVNRPDTGNKVLTNAVTPTSPGGGCATAGGCSTTTPVQSFTVTKKASGATATPGARVTYTVTVVNTGQAGYTTNAPASFTDDLSKVLDDATYNGDAVSSSDGADPGVVTFTSPKLVWSGPLAKGATVTVIYTVTVNTPDTGDHNLVNSVSTNAPGCEGDCTPSTTTPVQSVAFTKKADTDKVVPGERVTYTITATNTGQVAYTDAAPATFTDDLTQVLDDATYNGDAKATTGTTSYAKPTLSWSGPLPVGETSTITYTVTVNTPDTGDKVLDNAVVSNDPGSSCTPDGSDPDCRSVIPAGSFTVSKTASTDTAMQGSTITYTVTVTNTGHTAYTTDRPASFRDNLTQVLDDATYNGDAKATAGSTAYQRPNLTWSGPLAVGATVTVTYSATVNTPDTGDRQVINAVVPTGPGGGCATASSCTTTTTVPPGFAVHTGGTATPTGTLPDGWAGLTGLGIAALLGCAVVWFRRRVGQGKAWTR